MRWAVTGVRNDQRPFRVMASGPWDNYFRNIEAVRRALEGPMRAVARSQDAMERAMEVPLRDLARFQEQVGAAAGPLTAQVLDAQRAAQDALDGPLRAFNDQQRRLQLALRDPIAQFQRHQEAVAAALAGPYAAIARNQELIRAVMLAMAEAAAVDDEEFDDETLTPEQSAWLAEWQAAIGEWTPTWEQVEVFLAAVALLIGIIVYAAGHVDRDVAEELLEPAGLLCAAGALLINRLRALDRRREQ